MLVIRRAQLDALARARREEFARTATGWFEREFPHKARALGPGGVERALFDAVEEAASAGLTEQDHVLQFVRYREEFGDAFAQLPWAAEPLSNERFDASLKLALLAQGADAARHGEPDAE